MWTGGKKIGTDYTWSDGSAFTYKRNIANSDVAAHCITIEKRNSGTAWDTDYCTAKFPTLCKIKSGKK